MKKTMMVLLITITTSLILASCGSKAQTNETITEPSSMVSTDNHSDFDLSKFNGVTFQVPNNWCVENSDEFTYFYPEGDSQDVNEMVMASYIPLEELTIMNVTEQLDEVIDGIEESDGISNLQREYCIVDDEISMKAAYSQNIDEKVFNIVTYVIPVKNDGVFSISLCSNEKSNEDYSNEYDSILDSIDVPKTPNDAGSISSDKSKADVDYKREDSNDEDDSINKPQNNDDLAQKSNTASSEQSSALMKAKQYLSISAFSHDSLVEQLEYEGFSNEDAVYAADNCDADWTDQALKKAGEYLNSGSFSYTGLIDQLEYEKFSHDDAVNAADNCGADWNEQAAKKAAEYRKYDSFSHQGLVDQLEFEGFTSEQAEYGASETD